MDALPTELIVNIVELFFEECAPRSRSLTMTLESKPPWNRVRSILSASRTLRAIGLKLWFFRLRVKSEWNWDYISSIPNIYNWVREISYHNVTAILIPSIHPENFPALKTVSIRMLNIQRPPSVIDRIPRSVQCLEIWKFDTMIHDHLFSAIACRLPDLRELRLHGMNEFDKFGVGTLFDSADKLGQSIASSLGSIQTLRVLSLDVNLSPTAVLLSHASCPIAQPLSSCKRCISEYGEQSRENEIKVSRRIASSLTMLHTIEWCSCFSPRGRSLLTVTRGPDSLIVKVSKEDEYSSYAT